MLSDFSPAQLFLTPWTRACQAPLSTGFSKQQDWSGLSFFPSGDLSDPGTELASSVASVLQMESLPLSHWGSPFIYIYYS